MKAGADLQQAADAPPHFDHPTGWGRDAREDLEQGALASPVAADDAECLALLHLEGDIIQGKDALPDALEGVALANARVGVGLFAQARPPAVEIARERARANHAQVVLFGKMFNGDNGVSHGLIF